MKIKLSRQVTQVIPGINYRILLINSLDNQKKASSVSQLLRGVSVVTKNDLRKTEVKNALQDLINRGQDNEDALLETYLLAQKIKKIQNNKDLEGRDNLSNLLNFISLKYLLPLYALDLDQQDGDYEIDFYQPKKGKKAPDFEFSKDTKIIALLIPNLHFFDEEQFNNLFEDIDSQISKYCLCEVANVFSVDAENPLVDLGYQSELEIEKNGVQEPVINAPKPTAHEVTLKDKLQQAVIDAVNALSRDITLEEEAELTSLVQIEEPADPNHGEYSTSAAMKLAKIFQKSPQEIAEQIKSNISGIDEIESIEIVGPGFINFHIKIDHFITALDSQLAKGDAYGQSDLGAGKRVMIEFGSLNIAKPFGAHHLLTTIIGQTLVNLHRAAGFNVISADFPGDWGTQFGKLIYAYKTWGDKATVEAEPMKELLKLYIKFHDEAENDTTLIDKGREEFKKLEQGDHENMELWKWMSEISTKDIEKIYAVFDAKHDIHYPESKYLESCQQLLQEGKDKGIFTPGEGGAFIADLGEEGLSPLLVQKSDGSTVYVTRDLASIRERLHDYPDLFKMIYVVDTAQSLHFKQLFAVAQKMGMKANFEHVPYGRMSFADASMSTRKGNIVLAEEIIEEAKKKAAALIAEKSTDLSEEERAKVAEGVAIGAIKYAMIGHAPETDYVFDWNKILNFEGDSAPYLQYSLARAKSILRKAQDYKPAEPTDQIDLFSMTEESKALEEDAIQPFEKDAEKRLLKLLSKLPDRLEAAATGNKPNLLTSYLIQIAQTFNSFYQSVPVVKTQRQDLRDARIKLVKATTQVIKNGLNILGIATFERM